MNLSSLFVAILPLLLIGASHAQYFRGRHVGAVGKEPHETMRRSLKSDKGKKGSSDKSGDDDDDDDDGDDDDDDGGFVPTFVQPVTFPPTFPPPTPFPIAPTPFPIAPTPFPTPSPVTVLPPGFDPCPSTPIGGCSVCGEGFCVTNFDNIAMIPGNDDNTCRDLENAGYNGFIPPQSCAVLDDFISITCGCASGRPAVENNCPSISPGGCSICGAGLCVNAPDNIVTLPNNAPTTCGELEDGGENGFIPQELCPQIPPLVSQVCACGAGTSTPAPVPAPTPIIVGSCPSVPANGCSICGPGMCVSAPGSIVTLPGSSPNTCADLEAGGLNGFIPAETCAQLPQFLAPCVCSTGAGAPVTPAPVPVATPAPTPFVVGSCPSVPANGCSICGAGMCVSAPGSSVTIPGNGQTTCANLEAGGLNGFIPAETCAQLPQFLAPCVCSTGLGAPVTPAPVPAPTPFPTILATSAPTTPAPVPAPTPAPTVSSSFPACFICGEDDTIENPSNVFSFPGLPNINTCAGLEFTAVSGFISEDMCGDIATAGSEQCGCSNSVTGPPTLPPGIIVLPTDSPGGEVPTLPPFPIILPTSPEPTEMPVEPTPNPTVVAATPSPITPNPTAAPLTPSPTSAAPSAAATAGLEPCPEVPAGACEVCGEGLCVTIPEAVFSFPEQPSASCGALEVAGVSGIVTDAQCPFLPNLLVDLCGCASERPEGLLDAFNILRLPRDFGK